MINQFFKIAGRRKQYAPRVSFAKLIHLGSMHKLKWQGKFCDLTMKRIGNACEIQVFEFNGCISSNYSEPFMVDINKIKKYNKLI